MKLFNYGLTFDHFGLAVRNPETAIKVLVGLGYRCGEQVYDPQQKVRLVWCQHPHMPAVELVAPADEPGPVDNLLSDAGEMLYHLCFRSSNLQDSVAAIKSDGIRVYEIAAPKPAVLFDGRSVGFYHLKGFGLIEIVETA